MLRPTRIITALVLVSASVFAQQEGKERPGERAPATKPVESQTTDISKDQVKLSPEKGAWVVEVQSGGGFHGRGRGSLTVTSEGRLTSTVTEATCEAELESPVLEALARLARAARPFSEVGINTSVCSDCYTTSIVLRRRESDGSEQRYVAYWDDSTKKKMPAEIIKIYDAVLNARDCK